MILKPPVNIVYGQFGGKNMHGTGGGASPLK